MVQVRLMGDDSGRVDRVLELMLQALRACPDLVVGDTTRLGHRGGGGRLVFDVSLSAGSTTGSSTTGGPGPVWVRAERTDRPRATRPRVGSGRRALPPGGSR
ncbi:hypothetical protein ACIG5E_34240 [Kitasatospora sp. NPDC053057]|uniref:hypothetical protein n=1 Tax=Kitasatospora sp. NPDC053057 TaxID=3364062 RepID=UPI0037CA6796